MASVSEEESARRKLVSNDLPVIESRNRYLYCEGCADFVYDHGLERICGPQAKVECENKVQMHGIRI